MIVVSMYVSTKYVRNKSTQNIKFKTWKSTQWGQKKFDVSPK